MSQSNTASPISAKSQPSLLMLCLLATAISLFYVAITYSPGFLSGKGTYWQFRTDDCGVHITGLRYFIHDQWRFPIFDVMPINYPEGSNVIFTDSLPVMALFAKILYKLTSIEWNFLGFWAIVSNAMLTIGSVFLLNSFKIRSFLFTFAVSVMALCVYCFIQRSFYDAALSSFFLIVFALAFSFYALQPEKTQKTLIGFSCLLGLSLLTHLYLFIMVYAVFLATLFTLWTANLLSPRKTALWLILSSAVIAIIAVVSGYVHLDGSMTFNHGQSLPPGLDILEPLIPNQFSIFYNSFYAEKILPNNIGLSYVGAGVLLLWLYVFIFCFKPLYLGIIRHKWLFLMLAALLVYAFGSRICFARHSIFEYPMITGIKQLFQTFKGANRFFWPALYMISFTPLILIARHRKMSACVLILLMSALILQNLDVWKIRAIARRETSKSMPSEHCMLLDSIIPLYDMVVVEEKSDVIWKDEDCQKVALAISFLTGKHNTVTNYTITARTQHEVLEFDQIVEQTLRLDKKILYAVSKKTLPASLLKDKPVVADFNELVLVSSK